MEIRKVPFDEVCPDEPDFPIQERLAMMNLVAEQESPPQEVQRAVEAIREAVLSQL